MSEPMTAELAAQLDAQAAVVLADPNSYAGAKAARLRRIAARKKAKSEEKGWNKPHMVQQRLWQACVDGDAEAVSQCMEANVVGVDEAINGSVSGQSTLWTAAFYGKLDIVQLMIAWKADPNKPDLAGGWTPLHAAVYSGKLPVVRYLVMSGGADLNAPTGKPYIGLLMGSTPLDTALKFSRMQCIEFLKARCARRGHSKKRRGTSNFGSPPSPTDKVRRHSAWFTPDTNSAHSLTNAVNYASPGYPNG